MYTVLAMGMEEAGKTGLSEPQNIKSRSDNMCVKVYVIKMLSTCHVLLSKVNSLAMPTAYSIAVGVHLSWKIFGF